MRKTIALVLVFCLSLIQMFTIHTYAQNYNMSIDETKTVRKVGREMYGINCEWVVGVDSNFFDTVDGEIIQAPSFQEGWKDTFVFGRMAGCSSQEFKWKDALGNFESRATQTLWDLKDKAYLGIIEWIQALRSVTPDIKIAYVLNFESDTLEDLADLVEFLTGDGTINYNGGENWAEIRKRLGVEEPVDIFTWELGNELDWSETPQWKLDEYIAYCKKVIPIIKSIDPDAKITCHASTAAWANGDDWEDWHRGVLIELGDMIDFISFHYYYPASFVTRADTPLDRLEQDIVNITGSDRIKIYISEQAPAPNSYTYDKESPYDYCLPHTIWGATALAEFYLRTLLRDSVVATTCHSIDSSVWSICYRNPEGGHSLTATGETIKSFAKYGVGEMVETSLDSFSKTETSLIAGAAIRDADDNLNILFTNRSETDSANVTFNFADGEYRVKTIRKIHGDVRSADNWYRAGDIWEYNNPDRVEISEVNGDDTALTEFSFDPLSVYVLSLEKISGK